MEFWLWKDYNIEYSLRRYGMEQNEMDAQSWSIAHIPAELPTEADLRWVTKWRLAPYGFPFWVQLL